MENNKRLSNSVKEDAFNEWQKLYNEMDSLSFGGDFKSFDDLEAKTNFQAKLVKFSKKYNFYHIFKDKISHNLKKLNDRNYFEILLRVCVHQACSHPSNK